MVLGSLFDGSGGFPLAGALNGITPVWASEIEPYPIRVTKARFPNMQHLGSVLDVKGDQIAPVDIITFGSPCQDLSVSGKQLGIHGGERSRLFFEAIRIIKEMRNATSDQCPRFAVFENVPGAFSSNRGEDFQAVLQAFCEVCDPDARVPLAPKGKWSHAGCIVGDGYSVAWRVYDAQYWGVPQRRKRIYLIADFASERAGEILFESEGMCWNPAEGGEAWEGTADHAEGCAGGSGEAVYVLKGNAIDRDTAQNGKPWSDGASYTLDATDRHGVVHSLDCRNMRGQFEMSGTLQAKPNGGQSLNYQNPVIYDTTQITSPLNYSNPKPGDPCHPLAANQHPPLCVGNGQMCNITMQEISNSLDCMHDQQAILMQGNQHRKYIVRRLTPLECCRLQGFPDWWEQGVEGSDSARYKMWGNGIALPCAADVLRRIKKELQKDTPGAVQP